ncbi:probable leucine-rich repeat receptor-like protein kinase IMK3, partial [Tanacetum coccineum]
MRADHVQTSSSLPVTVQNTTVSSLFTSQCSHSHFSIHLIKQQDFFFFLFHQWSLNTLSKNTLLTIPPTIHLLVCTLPFGVLSQTWDGIIVTESNLQALQAFKQELIDPNGFLKSWNDSGYGACSGGWEGIKCAQGQVIVIQLPWRGLGGQLSTKIGQFQALRKLSLHDNAIGGLIPKELGFLPNLRGIQLYNNKFTGLIPPTLGSCTLLQNLDFSNNSLVGQIPDSFGNCIMLFNVNLSMNALSNSVPLSLINSNSLMFLSLQYNNFSGLVPDSWGGEGNGGKSKVKSLTFDHNFFSGRIPVSMSKLTELEVISFGHNKLNGEIPSE